MRFSSTLTTSCFTLSEKVINTAICQACFTLSKKVINNCRKVGSVKSNLFFPFKRKLLTTPAIRYLEGTSLFYHFKGRLLTTSLLKKQKSEFLFYTFGKRLLILQYATPVLPFQRKVINNTES